MKIPDRTDHLLFGGTFVLANKLQFVADKSVAGLSTKQWLLLRTIKDMPGDPPPTITRIAAEMDTTRQNVAKMLEILRREGLVQLDHGLLARRKGKLLHVAGNGHRDLEFLLYQRGEGVLGLFLPMHEKYGVDVFRHR